MDVSLVLESFSIETFSGHVGDGFRLEIAEAEGVSLTLIQVRPLGNEASPRAGGRRPFSLEFSGPPAPVLPQATYRFHHTKIGDFEMFIVPVGPTDGGMRYEAIFT
jgi:hypothetical protein